MAHSHFGPSLECAYLELIKAQFLEFNCPDQKRVQCNEMFNLLRELQGLPGLLVSQEKKVPQVFVVILVLMAVWEIEGHLGLLVVLETRVMQGKTGSRYVLVDVSNSP